MTTPTVEDLNPRDYRAPLVPLSQNVRTFIESHPDSFECLLYRADHTAPETVGEGVDVVGSIESNERTLSYQSADLFRAVIVPDTIPREVEIEGEESSTAMGEPVVLLLAADNVPQQSVVQYREYVDDTNIREVTLYIHHADQVGAGPGICQRYYCMPMQNFQDLIP